MRYFLAIKSYLLRICRNMSNPVKKNNNVVQVSITMERQLKERYAKLALEMDLSFSQLVRFALRRVAEGHEDYSSIKKRNPNSQ